MISGGIRQTLRSLRHRNYRLFFMGQGMSLIGTWIQRIALGWLVFRLTESEWLLGVVGFASQILTFVFSPVAGVLADRRHRRAMLLVTQVVSMLQAAALTVLTMGNWITVPEIIILSLMLGLINAFDIPIRQSFNVEMLENRGDLSNVVALNSFMFNGARLIAPMVAGVLIALLGGESVSAMFLHGAPAKVSASRGGIPAEAWCFLLNTVSFVAAIWSLARMTLVPREIPRSDHHVLHHLREGARYTFGSAPIRDILILLAILNLLGTPFVVIMPAFASKVLGGGAAVFGALMSTSGMGAMLGAMYLAWRRSVLGLGRVIAVAVVGFGLGLIVLAWMSSLWLAMPLLVFVGFAMMVSLASCNTLIQTIVEEDKRGRVMGFYTMAFMGVAPFGSLISGAIADAAGVSWTIAISGISCVLIGLAFVLRLPGLLRHIAPMYVKLGILSADGGPPRGTAPSPQDVQE